MRSLQLAAQQSGIISGPMILWCGPQSLRIKTFIGTSENAVRIQIWTALISMLLLRYLIVRSTWRWSFSNMVALLRQQIFVYRDLWKLLDQPGQPPVDLDDVQLGFDWQS